MLRRREDEEWVLYPRGKVQPNRRRRRQPRIIVFVRRGRPGTPTFRTLCIAKAWYTNLTRSNKTSVAGHVHYLQRDSAGNHDLGLPKEYGSCTLESFKTTRKGERRIWEFVLSPEEFFSLHPKEFLSIFMTRLGAHAGKYGAGQILEWAAAVHTDTSHPHMHILIHGVDFRGREVYFRPETLKSATALGTSVQRELTGDFLVSAELFAERKAATRMAPIAPMMGHSIDELIVARSGQTWKEALDSLPFYRRTSAHARMTFLERQDLLQVEAGGRFHVSADLAPSIRRANAEYDEVRSSTKFYILDDPPIEWVTPKTPKNVGIVTSIYRRKNKKYAIIETVTGVALVLPVDESQLIGDKNQAMTFDVAAQDKILVRLRRGVVEPFVGDPVTFMTRDLKNKGRVARFAVEREWERRRREGINGPVPMVAEAKVPTSRTRTEWEL